METPVPQEGSTGNSQQQSNIAQGIASSAQDIGQQPAQNAQLPPNVSQAEYDNTPPLIRRSLDQFTALPDEAWDYGMPNGTRAGVQYTDHQNVPGSLEYRVRTGDAQFRAANAYMFDDVKNAVSLSQMIQRNELSSNDLVGEQQTNLNAKETYFAGIIKKLPQSDRNPDGITNWILNVGQQEAKHNAEYLYKIIGPVLKQQINDAKTASDFPNIAGMIPSDIAKLALARGANPAIVNEFLASQDDPAKKLYKTSLYNNLMPMIESLDPVTNLGKLATLDPEHYLLNLAPGSKAQHDTWDAMAKWKEEHSTSFVSGIVDSVGHLAHLAGYGAYGVTTGSAAAVVTGVTGAYDLAGDLAGGTGTSKTVNLKSGETVLSDLFINGDQKERDKAQNAIERADKWMKLIGPELRDVWSTGKTGDATAYIEKTFGQYADPEMVQAFKDAAYYKKLGAYRPGYQAEKLAAFGEGVLDAAPAIYRFFNSSIDMNSWSFRRQLYAQTMDKDLDESVVGTGWDNSFIKGLGVVNNKIQAISAATGSSWVQGTELYKNMDSEMKDEAIKLWTKNYYSQTSHLDSKSAMMWDAAGFPNVAKIARGQSQDTMMVQAGQFADPFTAALVIGKWTGLVKGGAAATKAVEAIAKDYQTVAAEVAYEMGNAAGANGKLSPTLQAAVDTVREQLKKQYPGATITDEQAIAAALGQRGLGTVGRSASGKIIRQEVGAEIAKNQVLVSKVRNLEKAVDEITGTAQAAEGEGRAVGGRAMNVAGRAIDYAGQFSEYVGESFDAAAKPGSFTGTTIRRRAWFGTLRLAGNWAGPLGGANVLGVGVGASLALKGDFVGAALAGAGGIGLQYLIKPEFLRELGTSTQQLGRLTSAIGKIGTVGTKQGSSLYLQAANNLEAEARALGDVSTDATKAAKKITLASDASKLREFWRNGYEDATLNTLRVMWDDGVVGGGIGATVAHMADRDATGSGAGIGTALSLTLRSANRMWSMTPTGAQAAADMHIYGDLATQVRDMTQTNKARLFEYLGDIKTDPTGYKQRANIARDLLVANRGNVEFVNESEFASSFLLTQHPDAEAAMIMKEAAAAFPADASKAAAYAARRSQQVEAQRKAQNNLSAIQSNINEQQAKIDVRHKALQDGAATTAKLEADVATARQTDITGKVLDAANKALNDHLAVMSKHEMEIGILGSEMEQLNGQAAAARSEAANVVPFRPFEERTMPDGSSYQKVANGYYVETTPGKTGRVVIDIKNIDNIGAVSEGWHSLLNSEAAKKLMPEMIDMIWGDPTSGRRIMSDALREHFFDAYTGTLNAEQAARYKTQLALAFDNWNKGGKKDPSALIPYTQELMTWYMSTIDQSRRTNYRPGVSTPPGLGAPSPMASVDLRKFILGERGIRDNRLVQDFNLLLDPNLGIFAKTSGEHIKQSLEKAGMRFIEASDGTLRGYFFNNRNEIIRNPILNDFYERVLDITGGKGGERIKPVNLYDARVPIADRIDYVKARGMDWVLNEDGTNILTPQEVAQKSTEHSNEIRNSLAGVKSSDTGLVSVPHPDRPGEITFTGIPTQADIDAIASNQKIHPTIKANVIFMMESLAKGQSKEVLVGSYHNVHSVNEAALTEGRLMVGKDINGYVSTKHFVPLSIEFGFADVKDANGKVIKIKDADGKSIPLRQAVTRVNSWNIENFNNQKNRALQEGLVVRDKDGVKLGFYKSPDGRDYTPEMLKSLWMDDAAFMADANKWINHIYATGFQDPYSAVPSSIPKEPSAKALSPDNQIEGEAKRDAMRIIFGTDTADYKRSWVYSNRPGANTSKFGLRGTDFPIETLRLDGLGPLTTRGDTVNIDLRNVVGGGFALSPAQWKVQNLPLFENGKTGIKSSSLTLTGVRQEDLRSPATINVESVKTHPLLNDVKLYKGRDETGANVWAYTTGEGKVQVLNPSMFNSDVKAMKHLIGEIRPKEEQAWVDTALKGFRESEEQAQGIVNPAKNPPVEAPKPGAAKENPLYSQKDYDQIQRERDQLAAADSYEGDPAAAQEARARMRGDRIKSAQQIVLDHLTETRLREQLVQRGWTEEQAANQVAQMKSDQGWASYGEKVGKELDKQKSAQEKIWLDKQNQAVRDHWASENAEIARIEKERLEAHREAQKLKEQQGRDAESKRIKLEKAASRFDAQLTARKRALKEMVDAVISKQKVGQSKIESLNAEWLASDEPVIAPGLLKIDPANLPVAASQTIVGTIPIKGQPYTNVVSVPIYLERVAGFNKTQAGQATNQARFNNMVVPGSNMGIVNQFYRGPMTSAELMATIEKKKWISEGQTTLIAELKKAKAEAGGELTVYKVYGVNGNSVYIGTSASDALKTVQQNDENQRKAGSTKAIPNLSENVGLYTEMAKTNTNTPPKPVVNRRQYNELGDKYNQPTQR
jgi:hypothetical protein